MIALCMAVFLHLLHQRHALVRLYDLLLWLIVTSPPTTVAARPNSRTAVAQAAVQAVVQEVDGDGLNLMISCLGDGGNESHVCLCLLFVEKPQILSCIEIMRSCHGASAVVGGNWNLFPEEMLLRHPSNMNRSGGSSAVVASHNKFAYKTT